MSLWLVEAGKRAASDAGRGRDQLGVITERDHHRATVILLCKDVLRVLIAAQGVNLQRQQEGK